MKRVQPPVAPRRRRPGRPPSSRPRPTPGARRGRRPRPGPRRRPRRAAGRRRTTPRATRPAGRRSRTPDVTEAPLVSRGDHGAQRRGGRRPTAPRAALGGRRVRPRRGGQRRRRLHALRAGRSARTSTPSPTRWPAWTTRRPAGAWPARPGGHGRRPGRLGGPDVVPPRRPRPRDAPVPHPPARRGRAQVRRHRRARRGASGVRAALLPATDDPLATVLDTAEGAMAFQEYFVRRRHDVAVTGVASRARRAPARRPG